MKWQPTDDADMILQHVQQVWNLETTAYFGPVPHDDGLTCPVCHYDWSWLHIQHWRYHEKKGEARVRYRCDVGFKCTSCSAVWMHGIPLPEWYWNNRAKAIGRRVYWREAARLNQ